MDVLEAIRKRRTIRGFSKVPVEFDKVSLIIESGTYAPSCGNIQNWKFIIVTNKDIIKDLHNYCLDQYWISTAQVLIVVCARPEAAKYKFGVRGERLYSTQNVAAAVQNMLLTAHDLELGSAWIGAFDEDKIKMLFNIPKEVRPQAIVALGYPDYDVPEKLMQPIESQVYFNNYGATIKHLETTLFNYNKDVKRVASHIVDKANEAQKGASGFLKQKFEEFRENVKDLMELK